MALVYHQGQLDVQAEANTRKLAENLASWVGPVAEFTCEADLLIFATQVPGGRALAHTVLSGPAPLARVNGPSSFELAFTAGSPQPAEGRAGVLSINLATARRARINGLLSRTDAGTLQLEADETFTLCRKYMVRSAGVGDTVISGPSGRDPLSLDDPAIANQLALADCSFLGSASPSGGPDVAHRGGPKGFLKYDVAARHLSWPELLGDGVFKSAGNVRASGYFTLLVPDFETGDGIELVCEAAEYVNHRTSRQQRLDPLVQNEKRYPIQGEIRATVIQAFQLRRLLHPRCAVGVETVTSCSSVDEQAPQ